MKLRYTARALSDLDDIFAFYDKQSPQAAGRLKALLKTVIEGLVDFPGIGVQTDMAGVRALVTRRLPYRIFYREQGGEVQILHIRHISRRPWDEEDA